MKCKDCNDYLCSHRITDAERNCFFEEQMVLETSKMTLDLINWDKFRREVAKDVLCAIIASPAINNFKDERGKLIDFCKEKACEISIQYAEELVKQLKEKEEK